MIILVYLALGAVAGIMAGKEVLPAGERLGTLDPRLGPLDNLVDQQERLAVRYRVVDLLATHRLFIKKASTSLATITP